MKFFFPLAFCLIVFGCNNEKPAPDVSDIKVDVQLKRFDKDLFAADTNNIDASLNTLQQQYGSFLNDYLYNIMMLPPQPDSVAQKIKMFLHDYRFVYDKTQNDFKNFDDEFKQIKKGLQYVKYYFPSYRNTCQCYNFCWSLLKDMPMCLLKVVGYWPAVISGQDFSVYHSDFITEVYPDYQQAQV
jgi:hypothetical protein